MEAVISGCDGRGRDKNAKRQPPRSPRFKIRIPNLPFIAKNISLNANPAPSNTPPTTPHSQNSNSLERFSTSSDRFSDFLSDVHPTHDTLFEEDEELLNHNDESIR